MSKTENRIKEVRIALRMSQSDVAKKAGISQPYLYDLENNRRGAKPETFQKIADALGCAVDVLKGGRGDGEAAQCG